jgi:hypothetical protein
MRAKLDDGRIVTVKYIEYSETNIRLLLDLQEAAPNMIIECECDGRHLIFPMFRLRLCRSELQDLNPRAT